MDTQSMAMPPTGRSGPAEAGLRPPVAELGARVPLSALWAAGGPLALGAVLGATAGVAALFREAMALPLVVLGVTAVMVPALYIGSSLAGAAPTAGEFGDAALRGLRGFGVALVGLLAPAAFLLATTTGDGLPRVVGGAVTAAGALIGLRVFYTELFVRFPDAMGARVLFAAWALVSLGIGAHLYAEVVLP